MDRDDAREELEPRGTDICPECGSGHTTLGLSGDYRICGECKSRWSGFKARMFLHRKDCL